MNKIETLWIIKDNLSRLDNFKNIVIKISNIFNCGYGRGFDAKKVIDTVKKISAVNFKVEVSKRREGNPIQLISDNRKIITKMGWKPKHDDLELIYRSALEWGKRKQGSKC